MGAQTIQPELIPATDGNWKKTDALAVPTPMAMIQQAVAQGAGIDVLERLMHLQIRWEAHEAKKAFVEAMNRFKANPPEITKNKDVAFGNTKFSHATLDHVCAEVIKGLSAVGITHSWKTSQPEGKIRVTCVLTHEMGHSEDGATLEGSPDTSGSKNSIQAIGSAVTYLERYTLLAATGLAAKAQDDDGRESEGGKLDDLEGRLKEIAQAKDTDSLRRVFNVHHEAAEKANDAKALSAIIEAKNSRYKELTGIKRGA